MSLETFLAGPGDSILIDIVATRGSAPREAGTFMLVSTESFWGTIGGGNLEFVAIEHGRQMLAGQPVSRSLQITLGPDSGQCCGGQVGLSFQRLDEAGVAALRARLELEEAEHPDIFIFGAGHVGRALATALKPLPFRVLVVETRSDELHLLKPGTESRLVAMPEALVAELRPGGAAVIVTHDHALDFLIGAEALKRTDLAYIGMIGSKTKRGVFANWLSREGFAAEAIERLVLPIGNSRLRDKRPEVIAALVAAELLLAML